MKRGIKILGTVFALGFFVAPVLVNAVILIPTANITIVKNTVGGEGNFSFSIEQQIDGNSSTFDEFNLQTNGNTASYNTSIPAFSGQRFLITEALQEGWNLSGIVCISDNPANSFYPSENGVTIYPAAYSNITCTFTNSKEVVNKKTPVLIIPGILGTELYNGDDLIWPDLSQMFTAINDQFLTENLSQNRQGESVNDIQVGNTIKRKQILALFDQNIFEALEQKLELEGYETGNNIFFFPYDWRLDLNGTKDLLNQKIEAIKLQTGADKIDIVAHSMGGLLTKAYLNEYGKESVDKLIFVGTPHLGAPKAGKILLEGDRSGIPFLEEDRMRELALNSPALHELLPNQTYFKEFEGYLKKYKFLGDNPLLNYEETKDFYINEKDKNPIMFEKGESFNNQNLQDYDFSGIETYNIVGCKKPTQAAYSYSIGNWGIGKVGYTTGDGTVPFISSNYINIPGSNKYYVKDVSHAEMPSADGVRGLILGILEGNVGNLEENVSLFPGFCNFKGKLLSWHSPVEVHITDQNGNHTGPIENNGIEYGVPGIDYDVIGHNKFMFLPTGEGQKYQVEAKGLEKGNFDLLISEVEDETYLQTQVFNDVPVNTSTSVSFAVSQNNQNKFITVEEDGQQQQVQASAVLAGDEVLDLVPPETILNLEGKKWKDGVYRSHVRASLEATDEGTGVLEIWYSLDGETFETYAEPFVLKKKGNYTIYYYSVDKAGNNEEIQEAEVKIGKISKWHKKCWKNKKRSKIFKKEKRVKLELNKIKKKFKDKFGKYIQNKKDKKNILKFFKLKLKNKH